MGSTTEQGCAHLGIISLVHYVPALDIPDLVIKIADLSAEFLLFPRPVTLHYLSSILIITK